MPRHGDAKQVTGDCLRLTVLSLMVLAVLLMIGGVEQSKFLVLLWKWKTLYDSLCAGCNRNLKVGNPM